MEGGEQQTAEEKADDAGERFCPGEFGCRDRQVADSECGEDCVAGLHGIVSNAWYDSRAVSMRCTCMLLKH